MTKHILKLELFGAFRRYSDTGFMELEVDLPMPLKTLRVLVAEAIAAQNPGFNPEGLFRVTAFATRDEILRADAIIDKPAGLALIPPVSGG